MAIDRLTKQNIVPTLSANQSAVPRVFARGRGWGGGGPSPPKLDLDPPPQRKKGLAPPPPKDFGR